MFTEQQLQNFKTYRKVQMSGRWNMFYPLAQQATGLSDEEYVFVMENYTALQITADLQQIENE
jgi:hypothetical protein